MARLGRSKPAKSYILIRPVRGTMSFSSVLTESVTVTASVIKSISRTLADALTATDVFSGVRVVAATFSEVVTVTDSIVRSISRTLSDSLTATDSRVRSISRTLVDTVTATDVFSRVFTKILVLTESVTVTDTVRKVLNGTAVFWTHITKAAAATWTHITRN